jgi:hypothetical protein
MPKKRLDFGGKGFGERAKKRKRKKKVWNSYIGSMIPFVGQIDKA